MFEQENNLRPRLFFSFAPSSVGLCFGGLRCFGVPFSCFAYMVAVIFWCQTKYLYEFSVVCVYYFLCIFLWFFSFFLHDCFTRFIFNASYVFIMYIHIHIYVYILFLFFFLFRWSNFQSTHTQHHTSHLHLLRNICDRNCWPVLCKSLLTRLHGIIVEVLQLNLAWF